MAKRAHGSPPLTAGGVSDSGVVRNARVVVDAPVLTPRDIVLLRVLSLVAAAAILVLGRVWVTDSLSSPVRWPTVVAVCFVLYLLANWSAGWLTLWRLKRPLPLPPPTDLRVAAVTTFVASQESLAMLERTLHSMVGMRVPHDTWVLDEEDRPSVRALCERLGVRHFSRTGTPRLCQDTGAFRPGTKYGNYNVWLDQVGYDAYDIVAMFDPDHVPEAPYLERTLGYFAIDDVAFVQPPQVYYNQDASFVARAAAEESYAYYSLHLMASYAIGNAVVIGCHGVHRTTALKAMGGLPAHDADDLYLTMSYRAAGWRGVFVPEVLAMGMTPVEWSAYLGQQLRWSRAVLDLKLRVLPQLARQLSPVGRAMNLLHGASYLRALLVPVAYGSLAVMLIGNHAPPFLQPRPMMALAALLLTLALLSRFEQRYYLIPHLEGGFHWRSTIMQLAKWPMFARAVADAVLHRSDHYLVTPKGRLGPRTLGLAPLQLGVAAVIAACWMIGTARHGTLATPLTVAATLVVITSVAIAASDLARPAAAFDAARYARRRAAGFGAEASDALHDRPPHE